MFRVCVCVFVCVCVCVCGVCHTARGAQPASTPRCPLLLPAQLSPAHPCLTPAAVPGARPPPPPAPRSCVRRPPAASGHAAAAARVPVAAGHTEERASRCCGSTSRGVCVCVYVCVCVSGGTESWERGANGNRRYRCDRCGSKKGHGSPQTQQRAYAAPMQLPARCAQPGRTHPDTGSHRSGFTSRWGRRADPAPPAPPLPSCCSSSSSSSPPWSPTP